MSRKKPARAKTPPRTESALDLEDISDGSGKKSPAKKALEISYSTPTPKKQKLQSRYIFGLEYISCTT